MGLELLKFLNVATHFSVYQLLNGVNQSFTSVAILFVDMLGVKATSATESTVQRPFPVAITITEIAFRIVTNNLAGGNTITVGLRQNGVTQASTTIGVGTTGYVRVTGLNFNVAVADNINWIWDFSASGNVTMAIDQWVISGKIAIA